MKAGWEVRPLGEVAAVTKRQGGSRPLPYVGLEDIASGGTGIFLGNLDPQADKSTTFEFEPTHLLYGRLRPYLNKVMLPDFVGHCSSEIFPIQPSSHLDRRFLFYWLTNQQTVDAINDTCTGARMPRANVSELMTFRIPLPPLEEQQRIVAVLDEAFEGLSRARAHAEANYRDARELFATVLDELLGQEKFSWSRRSLAEACLIGDGNHSSKYPKNSEMVSEGVPFIRSSNIQNGKIDQHKMLFISAEKHRELKKGHLKANDILFSNRGEIGKVAIVPSELDGSNLNSQVAWLRCREFLSHKFLYLFLQSRNLRKHYLDTQSGAALQQFTIRMLKDVQVFFPALEDQEDLVETVNEIHQATENLEAAYVRQSAEIDALRQSLLQKAFAGEVT